MLSIKCVIIVELSIKHTIIPAVIQLMTGFIFILNWIYLVSVAIMTWITTLLYVRAYRSHIYFPFSLGSLLLLLSMALRILEMQISPDPYLSLLITVSLLLLSVALVLLGQTLYTLITRSRFTLIIQMLAGAGALLLFLFALRFVEAANLAYTRDYLSAEFIFYLLLPQLLFILYAVLFIYLVSRNHINAIGLSYDRAMLTLPDKIFVLDRRGYIIDRNQKDTLFLNCRNNNDLIQAVRQLDIHKNPSFYEVLSSLSRDSRGEIEWQMRDGQPELWSWIFHSVKNRRGKISGFILIFSELTRIRSATRKLQAQNDELTNINNQLSSYAELIERYSDAAVLKEIADIIDVSVRNRLDRSAKILENLEVSDSRSKKIKISLVIGECRQALTDVRSLVNRLTK